MTVYEAINKMRQRSKEGKSFAFAFMSYSIDTEKSHGEVEVSNAILLPRKKDAGKSAYAEHMLLYKDLDTGEVKHCWQPLIISYNNKLLEGVTYE